MTIAELPSLGTDRFTAGGKVGRLVRLGAGCAIVQWEREQAKEFTARTRDKTTGEVVERVVRVPDREEPGPVTLAMECEPVFPPSGIKPPEYCQRSFIGRSASLTL